MSENFSYNILEQINSRPKPFEFYTASELWTNEHTSKQMLAFHLNEEIDVSSRNAAFINRSIEWIASRFNVKAGTKIAGFGCGPGLYAVRLAKKQADVTAIDFSRRSIEYAEKAARQDGVKIEYIDQDYLTFESDDRFDLIIMIMCDYCALSPHQRKQMLSKFSKLLKAGGSVLLDVYTLIAFSKREEQAVYEENQLSGFWFPHKYYGFLNTFKYDKEKVALDKFTIVEPYRTRTVYNWLQYFSPESLTGEFMEGGFIVDDLFADVAGTPFDPKGSEFAIIARKP